MPIKSWRVKKASSGIPSGRKLLTPCLYVTAISSLKVTPGQVMAEKHQDVMYCFVDPRTGLRENLLGFITCSVASNGARFGAKQEGTEGDLKRVKCFSDGGLQSLAEAGGMRIHLTVLQACKSSLQEFQNCVFHGYGKLNRLGPPTFGAD